MTKSNFLGIVVSVVTALGLASPALAQSKISLKFAHFVPPQHFMAKYLAKWAADLGEKSDGAISVTMIPGAQMGPPPKYYDLARRGATDITWLLHGATPGRFPLTELIQLPYIVPSAEVGTLVLNHPDLRPMLDKEHRGLHVLYLLTHQPGNLHTAAKPVRTAADLKGLRIRFASPTIREWVAALGGTPVGMPPTQIADGLQKKTIDGVFIDYGGAHTAFKLGGLIKYTTEMYSYVSSFAVAMNPAAYRKLPGNLRKLVDETTTGISSPVGKMWDDADGPGKAYIKAEGGRTILLSAAENANFKRIAQGVTERRLAELEKKGLPARKVYATMKRLSGDYAKTSKNFWLGLERR